MLRGQVGVWGNLGLGAICRPLLLLLECNMSINRLKWRLKFRLKHISHDKLVFYLAISGFFLLVFSFLSLIAVFAWVSKDLPSPSKLTRRDGFATRIMDRHEKVLYDVYKDAKRSPVGWEEVPDYLKLATVSVEDKEFYSHPGFSVRGIVRAVYSIIAHHRLEGGSTLTQQLVKNVLLTPERTISRKVKEFILSLQVERKYNKDEILLMYLNEAPYGGSAWGVGAATEQYFGKKVADLNLVESAFLAGLPQRPSVYSPFSSNPKAYIGRTKTVLRRMREDGYITSELEKESLSQLDGLEFNENRTTMRAPHFVIWVKNILEEKYGEEIVERGGLRVVTSLDLELQNSLEKIVKDQVEKNKGLNITNGAALVMDPQTGQVLALVGSKDYFADDIDGKFNVVTQGLRQPGSAIKPVTYSVALEKGYTAASPIMDTKTVFPIAGQKDYVPVNYDGHYHGPLSVRYALGNSINVPAVKALAMVGKKNMLTKAYQMGISSLEPNSANLKRFGLSVTLGGGEVRMINLASAYLAFANGGIKHSPTAILKVFDRDGNLLEEFKPVGGKRVLSPGIAFIISDILSDDNARLISFGAHSKLYFSDKKVAVKTGTTNDKRDNWAIGWTPNVLVASWVGNNDNSPMKKVASGISGATPIWQQATIEALRLYGYQEFKKPDEVKQQEVDVVSGWPAHDGFPARKEYFISGTQAVGKDPLHTKLKLCRGQDKLATPAQVLPGDYEEKEFFVFKEEDPVSQDGKNRWQEGILAWMFSQKDSRYHPPNDYCNSNGMVAVSFVSPAHEAKVSSEFTVKIQANSVNLIKKVVLYVDDKEVQSFDQKPYEAEISLDDGTYTLKVMAEDEKGNQAQADIKIGVNRPWDWQPSPSPTPTTEATPTPTPTLTPNPTLTPSPVPSST